MNHSRGELCLISCNSGLHFAKKVLKEINKKRKKNIHLIDIQEVIFANTEVKTIISESIRGKDVFIIQDVENHYEGRSVDENLRALYTVIGACRRCDANYITAVLPAYPYSRQDKQWGREDITAARVAWELEGDLGADHVITIDLHNISIQGFFRSAQVEDLKGSHKLIPYIKKQIKDPKNTVIIPTDLGGAKRANYYADHLKSSVAFTYKSRDYSKKNQIENVQIMGDVEGKDVYIIDDMIDTGGTFCKTVEVAKKAGAKRIVGIATFGLLNGPALERLEHCYKDNNLDEIIFTDASYIPNEILKKYKWMKVLSVAEYFAEIIHRINKRISIGELLD